MKIDQRYELVRLDSDEDILKPHPRNPNKGDDSVVEESIDVNGWYGAVTAQQSTGYILAGHTRWRVAIKKGAKEIPVIWRDVDDETALKILLADNETAKHAYMDEALLEELLAGLESLDGTGFALASAQETIEAEGDTPDAPDESAPTSPAADADSIEIDPNDIPDDQYEPQYGVMIVCDTALQQKTIYDWLKRNGGNNWALRVVAT